MMALLRWLASLIGRYLPQEEESMKDVQQRTGGKKRG